jgi:hypothetical protein
MFFKSAMPYLFVLLTITSCYKTKPTELEVTVRDAFGNVVNNASVIVFGEPTGSVNGTSIQADYQQETNTNGIALFAFNDIYQPGQNGVAILKVEVNKNEKIGMSTIEIVQERTNHLVIVIE